MHSRAVMGVGHALSCRPCPTSCFPGKSVTLLPSPKRYVARGCRACRVCPKGKPSRGLPWRSGVSTGPWAHSLAWSRLEAQGPRGGLRPGRVASSWKNLMQPTDR